MSLDREIQAAFERERRRTASILRDVDEYIQARRVSSVMDVICEKEESLLLIAARHLEHGDEYGTLHVECAAQCHYETVRTELLFGATSTKCCQCDRVLQWKS